MTGPGTDPDRFGTDPESRWEAALDTEHRAEHRAARGVQAWRVSCPDCRAARVAHILGRA